MNKEKFDIMCKIALLIILVFAMIIIFVMFKQMSIEGISCLSQPFRYGAMQIVEKQTKGEGSISCTCQLSHGIYTKPYSFREIGKNSLFVNQSLNHSIEEGWAVIS